MEPNVQFLIVQSRHRSFITRKDSRSRAPTIPILWLRSAKNTTRSRIRLTCNYMKFAQGRTGQLDNGACTIRRAPITVCALPSLVSSLNNKQFRTICQSKTESPAHQQALPGAH